MKFRSIVFCVICVFVVFAAVTGADAKRKKSDVTKHPGFVDFEPMEVFGAEFAKIEINLNENMIKLIAEFVKKEDPDLYEMLIRLLLVRVEVYERTREIEEKFESESSKAAKLLDDREWERIVRVRERDEHVYVYVKPSDEYDWVQGIVVLAMEDDEAVFVNIVGDIKPENISRIGDHFIGNHFDIEELDSIRQEMKKGN